VIHIIDSQTWRLYSIRNTLQVLEEAISYYNENIIRHIDKPYFHYTITILNTFIRLLHTCMELTSAWYSKAIPGY